MTALALYVRLEAKPGKEEEVAALLGDARSLVIEETGTTAWFAIRLGPSTFAIFDAFSDEQRLRSPSPRQGRGGADDESARPVRQPRRICPGRGDRRQAAALRAGLSRYSRSVSAVPKRAVAPVAPAIGNRTDRRAADTPVVKATPGARVQRDEAGAEYRRAAEAPIRMIVSPCCSRTRMRQPGAFRVFGHSNDFRPGRTGIVRARQTVRRR